MMGSCFNCVIFIPILAAAVYFLFYQQVDYDVFEYHFDIDKDMDSLVQWWGDLENLKKVHPFMLAVKIMDEQTNNIEVNGKKTTELYQKFFSIERLPFPGGIVVNYVFDVNKRIVHLKDTATVEFKIQDDPLLEFSCLIQMTRSNGGGTKVVEYVKTTTGRLMYYLNKDTMTGAQRKMMDNFKQLTESN